VILLVPEIALTPQSVAVYCSYFGNRAAVLHSALSAGERADVWRKARSGAVDLVIGTRSAVFTPFERLGLIVIDEEQEHTYKSDQSPRYHARDVARFRCAASRALLLLASATPSFESYYKAERGAYTLLRLTERYGGASLPDVVLDDIRGEITRDGNEPLGKTLSNYLTDTIQKGEQAVFFLNRRGYHKYLSCLSCRQTVFCEHCSIPMTLHSGKGARKEETDGIPAETGGVLVCHYCGARRNPPAVCPSCSSPYLQAFGYGTQRVEEELAERFPSVRTLRMDLDTTQGKDAHERILQRFRNREADLLLGTQMVTKGHDFPDVTLVGVIAADALLSQDDFRASERTFALLTQVIGRAGRSDRRGVAVIQTYRPENEVFRLAAKQDYETFYRKHIGFRKEMVYPPFCDIVLFSASGKEEREVRSAADQLAERIASETAGDGRFSNIGLSMFGPFEAPVYRVREQYRMQIILKCRLNSGTRTFLAFLLRNACNSGRVSIVLDCNPTNL
ncbi:MAG: primosomal protein N', partial [Candidatus Methanomethylophilaceae archaeon]|nr:primosomal protein N' [Candidatus Methanomethylophilaceae archaeon]